MSSLKSTHDKSKCYRCNVVGKNIIDKLKRLVAELEDIVDKEEEEEETDIRCIMNKGSFVRPLITFPDEPERELFPFLEVEKGTPVWELKRYPSKELIAGDILPICTCSKRNGLTDCSRWHCRGRAGCYTSPPCCPASRLWANPITDNKLSEVINIYNTDKIKACNYHTVWDPNCHLCRFYVKKVDKMMSFVTC